MLEELVQTKYPKMSLSLINVYIKIALDTFMNYFKNQLFIDEITEDKLLEDYTSALYIFICNAIDLDESKGVKLIKQGNKQISYNTYVRQFEINQEILNMLPMARVKPISKEEMGLNEGI